MGKREPQNAQHVRVGLVEECPPPKVKKRALVCSHWWENQSVSERVFLTFFFVSGPRYPTFFLFLIISTPCLFGAGG